MATNYSNNMDNKIINTGLIHEPPQEKDWVFGGVNSGAFNTPLFSDGHGWLTIQRDEQTQRNANFDTFSCVTFSCLKALSYYVKKIYNLDVNFSERFTAVMSGTTPGKGNSIRNVLESIRKDGFLLENDCPFTNEMTQSEFFSPITQSLKDKAKKNLQDFMGLGPIIIEWEVISNNPFSGGLVDHDQIREALKYSPVITTGFAWNGGPIYVNGGAPNHCFLGIDWDDQVEWDVMADDNYPADFSLDHEPDVNYLKKLSRFYSLYSAYKITARLANKPASLITNFKKMFNNMRAYMDTHGLNVFWVDVAKKTKQKIEMTSIAEKALFMSAYKDGDIKKSSWPELQPLEDNKFF